MEYIKSNADNILRELSSGNNSSVTIEATYSDHRRECYDF